MSDRVKNNRTAASPVIRCGALALEPRILLDAAMVDTFVDSVEDGADNPDDAQQTLDEQQDSTESSGGDELVFVDSEIENLDAFLSDIDLSTYEVHVIERGSDGFAQIGSALEGRDSLSAVHIVSHGNDGALRLAGQVFTEDTLAQYSDVLGELGQSMADNADLLLYGCNIAETDQGQAFADALAQQTGTDVAASENIFGLTGNHELEYETGDIETEVMPSLFDYAGDLLLEGEHIGSETGNAQGDELGWAMDSEREWVVVGGQNQGEATVYRVEGATREPFSLVSGDSTGSSYGEGVAISGDAIVVAEPDANKLHLFESTGNPSSPWTFNTSITTTNPFQPVGTVTSSNGGTLELSAGYLAMDGTTIAVGDPGRDVGYGVETGRVLLITDTSSGEDWSSVSEQIITNPFPTHNSDTQGAEENSAGSHFGAAVAIDQGYMVIGAPTAFTYDSGTYDAQDSIGRTYIYDTSGNQVTTSEWNHLNGNADVSDGAINSPNFGSNASDVGAKGAFFGGSVDISFNNNKYTILAGAPGESNAGEMYLYETTSADMSTLQVPANFWESQNSTDAFYAASATISEGKILIGAYNEGTATNPSVYYYEVTDDDWSNVSGYNGDDLSSDADVQGIDFTESQRSYAGSARMGWQAEFTRGNVGIIGSPQYSSGTGAVDFFVMRTPEAVLDQGLSVNEDDGATSFNITNNDIFGSESLSSGATIELLTLNGDGTASISTDGSGNGILTYNPNGQFEYLAQGETARVTAFYQLNDAAGEFSSSARVEVTINGQNDAPVARPPGLPDFSAPIQQEQNGSLEYVDETDVPLDLNTDAFFDVDASDTLSYSISSAGDNPSWLTLTQVSGTWTFQYDLSQASAGTSHNIVIQASDGNGGTTDTTSDSASFTFNVDRANYNPDIGDTLSNQVATEDSIFEFATDGTSPDGFTDPDNPDESLSYEITSGPEFLNINPDTGVISGVPTNDDVTNWDGGSIADHSVTVEVTDRYPQFSQPVSQIFDLQVDNVNDAPFVPEPIGQRVATVGQTFNFDLNDGSGSHDDDLYFRDVDPTNDNLSYTAELIDDSGNVIRNLDGTTGSTGGPGDWLTYDAASQSFGGSPDDPLGTILDVRLTASDDATNSKSVQHDFEIGVFPPDGEGGRVDEGGATDRHMGDAVAISDDGVWRAYGAPGTAGGGGEVNVYDSSTGTWYTLTGDTGSSTDAFGSSVALSSDGSRLVVGAPGEGASRNGSFYVFDWDAGNSVFNQVHKFTGGSENRVGASVAISGDGNDVFVGIPHNDIDGLNAGRVRQLDASAADPANWTWNGDYYPQADANGSTDGDLFGRNIAYDQGILVVGTGSDTLEGTVAAGSVTVIDTSSGQQVKLDLGLDADTEDRLGGSVDIDVFTNSSGGTSALITAGAQGDDTQASDAGAVYVYRSDDLSDMNNFVLQDVVTAYDGAADHRFGASVAVDVMNDNEADGMRMLASGDLNASNDGAVYAHRYWGESWGWIGQRYLADTSGLSGDAAGSQYGWSVALAGQQVATGSPSLDYGSFTDAGASYYFDFSGNGSIDESLIEEDPNNPSYAAVETGEQANTKNASGDKTATEDFAAPEQQAQQVARAGSGDEAGVAGSPAGEATLGRGQEVGEAQAGPSLADAAGEVGAAGADSLDRQIDRAADEFDRAAREWSALADDIVA